MKRGDRPEKAPRQAVPRNRALFPAAALPIAIALALALPCFGFTYLFDDFDFLERAQAFRVTNLLPDTQSVFYRPLSREIYFGLLAPVGLDQPIVAHILNAVLLAIAVVLLVQVSSLLLSRRAGLLAGILFAGLGPLPLLVGWASGIQDLLAIVFVLGALLLHLSGRRILAAVAVAAAILSKESAVAAVPVLAATDWILGRQPYRLSRNVLIYGALLMAWALIHPGFHILSERGFRSEGTGYVGLDNPYRLISLVRSALTLANLPVTGVSGSWVGSRAIPLILALALAAVGLSRLYPHIPKPKLSVSRTPNLRVLVLASLLIVLPIALTISIVRHWAPYYCCLPGIGSSILFAAFLERQPARRLVPVIAIFLALGVVARGAGIDPSIATEMSLGRTSDALRRVETGFKKLWPTLPRNSNVYVAAQVTGAQSVYIHLNRLQPLRVWYRDPTILTLNPRRRATAQGPEFLVWISPTLDVFGIDPQSLEPKSSGPKPQLYEYQQTLRNYARGLADAGQTDRAVKILLDLPQIDSVTWSFDCRHAAMYLFADRRDSEALQLLSRALPIDSVEAAPVIADLMLDTLPKRSLDQFALRAFGVRCTLADLYRRYMRFFDESHFQDPAREFARKLQAVAPGDRESANILRRLGPGRPADRITTPAWRDSV